jgi:hypothetical protein
MALAQMLQAVEGNCIEQAIVIRAKELVPSRLVAVRMPAAIVNARRSIAKRQAKQKGDTPSKAHRTLLAWHLFISNVPNMIWKTETVSKAYPIRWQIELIFKSWKSDLHLASINTKKAPPPFCDRYGRMRFILLNYALCPQRRHTLWLKKKRELRVLKLARHFQALADRWMHALFQSEFALRRFLQWAWATAERLAAKASRKRQTTAQILRESLSQHHESMECAVAVNAELHAYAPAACRPPPTARTAGLCRAV